MTDRAALWHTAAALARDGQPAAFATVCRRHGSLPMAGDAKMLIALDGRSWGTVGGGCVEADVIAQAREAMGAEAPVIVSHTLNADLAGDIGLSCGGTVDFFLEPIVRADQMARLYDAVGAAVAGRVRVSVRTGLDWDLGPAKEASTAERTIRVGTLRAAVRGSGATGAPHLSADGAVLVEPIPRIPRVIILGAGHVGAEIAHLAARAGFQVVVADDRADFANAERLPAAHAVFAEPLAAVLDRLVLDGDDYVLATTRGHQHDADVIARVAPSAARYVGMLGSRRKREIVFRALVQIGVPADAVERVRVPIGEDIGAETPEEIAVSVVAELIRVRRTAERESGASQGPA